VEFPDAEKWCQQDVSVTQQLKVGSFLCYPLFHAKDASVNHAAGAG
jgi:hypothetical protein